MAQGKITEIEGDLFDAPNGAALIHACNCQGSWGAGIAKAFKSKYPAAFKIYRDHCNRLLSEPEHITASTSPDDPVAFSKSVRLPIGTALLIPPQEEDIKKGARQHWVVCLFTSEKFGRSVDTAEVILENTVLAVADLKRQINALGPEIGELWSCRFNSGLFRVDWKESRKVLEDFGLTVTVVRPEGEAL